MTFTGIGAPVRRKEDFRFITGKGQYTDDINRQGQTYAAFVRSPHAHAVLKSARCVRGAGHAGRARRSHRRGSRGRQDRRPDLRLDDPFNKDGSPMKRRRTSGAGGRQACGTWATHVAVVIAETFATRPATPPRSRGRSHYDVNSPPIVDMAEALDEASAVSSTRTSRRNNRVYELALWATRPPRTPRFAKRGAR